MPRPFVLDAEAVEAVRRLAKRRSGVQAAEAYEHLGAVYICARNTVRALVRRLVREGRLRATGERRPRVEVFERPGRGGVVYRAGRLTWRERREHGARNWLARYGPAGAVAHTSGEYVEHGAARPGPGVEASRCG